MAGIAGAGIMTCNPVCRRPDGDATGYKIVSNFERGIPIKQNIFFLIFKK